MAIDFTACCDRLSDAIWWFKGYAAGRPSDEYDQTEGLSGRLTETRRWLIDAASGQRRVLDFSERDTAFVLREGEYESINDGLRVGASQSDIAAARNVLAKIDLEIRQQQNAMKQDPEIPF